MKRYEEKPLEYVATKQVEKNSLAQNKGSNSSTNRMQLNENMDYKKMPTIVGIIIFIAIILIAWMIGRDRRYVDRCEGATEEECQAIIEMEGSRPERY